MKLLILLAVIIGTCLAYNPYRRQRDVIELSGKHLTSYDTDNIVYVSPQSSNQVSGYDYPKPLPEVQPPKPSLLYLPAEPAIKTPVEVVLQPLPSETRPKYAGTGNYIFEIQGDVVEKSHTVDVENPLFRNTIYFDH